MYLICAKVIHLKNLWSFVIMLICRDCIEIISLHYLFTLPWEWYHDDANTSAFNVNIHLLNMLKEIIIDQDHFQYWLDWFINKLKLVHIYEVI